MSDLVGEELFNVALAGVIEAAMERERVSPIKVTRRIITNDNRDIPLDLWAFRPSSAAAAPITTFPALVPLPAAPPSEPGIDDLRVSKLSTSSSSPYWSLVMIVILCVIVHYAIRHARQYIREQRTTTSLKLPKVFGGTGEIGYDRL